MKKKIIETPHSLKKLIGSELGKSPWLLINQVTIDKFAKATGDFQWIHVDLNKAKKESPYKNTIAHGYLSLSLIPKFVSEIWECKKIKLILNYGTEKIRFISPVISGNYIRANISVLDAKDYKEGILLTSKINIEIKDHSKIALSAVTLSMLYE